MGWWLGSPRASGPGATFGSHENGSLRAQGTRVQREPISSCTRRFILKRFVMRSTHVIIGFVSFVLGGCARLVPPDAIVALEVGPQQVNVMVGAKAPLKMTGTRGDGRTVSLSARDVQFASSDTSVAQVTREGAVQGMRLGRASISARITTPSGFV